MTSRLRTSWKKMRKKRKTRRSVNASDVLRLRFHSSFRAATSGTGTCTYFITKYHFSLSSANDRRPIFFPLSPLIYLLLAFNHYILCLGEQHKNVYLIIVKRALNDFDRLESFFFPFGRFTKRMLC